MLKNYFKIVVRNLTKQKGYTAINIVGLGIGMGICLFRVLLDYYALNFDTHYENSHCIYRWVISLKRHWGVLYLSPC